ncbi:MAG: 4-alpha-glucanotransferase, partial [Beijerinckiaceae bacterium]|nr:4-alpha-glucanotransferase [Beijerinckiaceae bacterium]
IVQASEQFARDAPDANDRYMLLQTIVGAWPVSAPDCAPAAPDNSFRERVTAYAIKALRESRRRTSWTSPDEAYEAAAREWIEALLAPDGLHPALAATLPPVARAGERVSLARLALKLTAPGTPDTYQGCEFEDYSLVDPDNRRRVDFAAHAAVAGSTPKSFGPLKQAITATLLQDRARTPRLYSAGGYKAEAAPHPAWLAYSRRCERDAITVAALTRPFEDASAAQVLQALSQAYPASEGWSNLLEGHALDQRKHGGEALPAIVLRKSL